jgi:hypothetical protein
MSINSDNVDLFNRKVPTKNQAAITKVAELVYKMGGQVRTHVQDNGGFSFSE